MQHLTDNDTEKVKKKKQKTITTITTVQFLQINFTTIPDYVTWMVHIYIFFLFHGFQCLKFKFICYNLFSSLDLENGPFILTNIGV